MQKGVYLNCFKGNADLLYYNGSNFEYNKDIEISEINIIDYKVIGGELILIFEDLEYLGEL